MPVLTYGRSPDLPALFAKAVVTGRFGGGAVPPTTAQRRGVAVDLDHLVDYAHLLGFTVGSALPVTYPHVLAFPLQVALMARRDFPFPLVGLVHVENVVTWTRPLAPTEPLDLAVSAGNLRPHRRGRLVDLVAEVSVAGEPVWRGVSSYLARGEGDPTAPTGDEPDPTAVAAVAARPDGARWRFGEDAGRRYGAVSGDVNPIHLHALTARPLGFPSAIAHGMATYGRVVASLGRLVPPAGTSHVWFRRPVRLPSTTLLKAAPDGSLAVLLSARPGSDGAPVEHLVVATTPA
ncbi:MaoC/PaaZ C-terminal domain-containing protein [Lapillicoccus jejuensis]|uniref:MaoC dehydratase-like protein n=1 Tax=Lapillicoccus jejuensis TaxID=402171 RepID=A0A542E5D1_9MICO|nr:MaoC/PaaZ C-terminal domain-containing protein [Lapillicoccus jejuensis]TQJ10479.1 MaoC dehydratase-like protein [Lapillicoccus jejuensis]